MSKPSKATFLHVILSLCYLHLLNHSKTRKSTHSLNKGFGLIRDGIMGITITLSLNQIMVHFLVDSNYEHYSKLVFICLGKQSIRSIEPISNPMGVDDQHSHGIAG